MRVLKLRILGLLSALALLLSFGLLAQVSPAAAAGPSGMYAPQPANVAAWMQTTSGVQVMDNSTLGVLQVAAIWNPASMMAVHLEHRVKLRRHWTAENGTSCTIKGGGQVFVPEGAPVPSSLTC
jgi:hypothetical protein